MKNLLFTLLFITTTTSLFSQDKCKYEKNEVDPFTKSKVIITDWIEYSNGIGVHGSFKLQLLDNVYTLYISNNFNTTIEKPMLVEKDQEMIILLENGDTVVSKANTDITGTTKLKEGFQGSYYASVNSNYNLTAEQIEKIKTSPLKSIRVYIKLPTNQEDKCTLGANKKMTQSLIKAISCVEKG